MPSRIGSCAIVIFWLLVVGYLTSTRVIPWITASATPAILVTASDETAKARVRWSIWFNKEKAGSLVSELKSENADTHTFLTKYTDVRMGILGVTARLSTATSEVTIDRAGQLRRQSLVGTGEIEVRGIKFPGSVTIVSTVSGGQLRGYAEGSLLDFRLDRTELPPVPVPSGQVLNPLLPVNRLSGVEPGKRWTIRRVDPLGDSLRQLVTAALAKALGEANQLFASKAVPDELLAEVQAEPESLPAKRGEQAIPCWVIVYRLPDNKIAARTWVSVADGRVLRQEATHEGSSLKLERDD